MQSIYETRNEATKTVQQPQRQQPQQNKNKLQPVWRILIIIYKLNSSEHCEPTWWMSKWNWYNERHAQKKSVAYSYRRWYIVYADWMGFGFTARPPFSTPYAQLNSLSLPRFSSAASHQWNNSIIMRRANFAEWCTVVVLRFHFNHTKCLFHRES